MTRSVQRIVEMHAAVNGNAIAVMDARCSCTYRELNAGANVLARRLMSSGFRRGMCADVRMAPSTDLAVVLLAVLKAGGCYRWSDPDPMEPSALRIKESTGVWREVEIGDIVVKGVGVGPNLPVVARETDIACVLDREASSTVIAVPHATIISMASCAAAGRSPWAGEAGAFDLWAALVSGTTAVVEERPAVAA